MPRPRKESPITEGTFSVVRAPRARAIAIAVAALIGGALALAPIEAHAAVVRVAVVATSDAPEVARLRAENIVATHRDLELAGTRALPAGAPRNALVEAARRLRADLLLVVDARSTRLWDGHLGRYVGVALGPDASRTALRGLIADGLREARPAGGGVPTWVTIAVAGAAAALFATFVLVRATAPDDPQDGLTLRVVSP